MFQFLFQKKYSKDELFILIDQIKNDRDILRKLKEPMITTFSDDLKLLITSLT